MKLSTFAANITAVIFSVIIGVVMRLLSSAEQIATNGANGIERIEPRSRWFTNELGIDAYGALSDYMYAHYSSNPNIALFGSLPAGFVHDMAELYYRSVSYEDAFWLSLKVVGAGVAVFGAGFGLGYGLGQMR